VRATLSQIMSESGRKRLIKEQLTSIKQRFNAQGIKFNKQQSVSQLEALLIRKINQYVVPANHSASPPPISSASSSSSPSSSSPSIHKPSLPSTSSSSSSSSSFSSSSSSSSSSMTHPVQQSTSKGHKRKRSEVRDHHRSYVVVTILGSCLH
jgi:hypothetical protein